MPLPPSFAYMNLSTYFRYTMKEQVLDKLQAICRHLAKSQEYISRSELAYNLRDYGITQDSNELSELIFELLSSPDQYVREGLNYILDNSGDDLLINHWYRFALSDEGDASSLRQESQSHLEESRGQLSRLESFLNSQVVSHYQRSLIATLTGQAGIQKVKEEALSIVEHYGEIAQAYQSARSAVEKSVLDFITFRELLLEKYLRYTDALRDAFGSQIQSEMPELFDFDSIEYLDPQQMLHQIQLEFNKLDEKCGMLMGEVGQQFSQMLKQGLQLGQNAKDPRFALLASAFLAINHYIDVSAKTSQLRAELSTLKTSATKDLSQIRADMERLHFIYNKIEQIFIPKIDLFYRFADAVLSEELEALIAQLYSDPQIRDYCSKRETLQRELKSLHRQDQDCKRNIADYSTQIQEIQALLEQLEQPCQEAKNTMPRKPSFIKVLFSFGNANKQYYKAAAEWKQYSYPFVQEYESLKASLEIYKEDLSSQQSLHQEVSRSIAQLTRDADKLSRQIRQSIQVDDSLKRALYPHINSLVCLLRSAKEIISSKLDKQYLSVVKLDPLPHKSIQEMSDAQVIRHLLEVNREHLHVSESIARKIGLSVSEELGYDAQRDFSPEDLAQLTLAQNEVLQRGVAWVEETLKLQEQLEQDSISQAHYIEQLAQVQASFRRQMAFLEDEVSVLKRLGEQVKQASGNEALTTALMLLAGKDGVGISEKEWSDFLNGNSNINI